MEPTQYIQKMKSLFPIERIEEALDRLKDTKVLVIGDTIIDEYIFTRPKGRAIKDPILSVDYLYHEEYAGGVLATANHLADFVKSVTLLTLVGDRDDKKDFIKGALSRNIEPHFFTKDNSPTTTKQRYLNQPRNEKLFKIEFMNDFPISPKLEKELLAYLEEAIPEHDAVVVSDFGHGFINDRMVELIERASHYVSINAQCNSANMGFNLVTKYNRPSFATMDLQELQFAVGDRFSPYPVLIEKLKQIRPFQKFLVTLGKEGAVFCSGKDVVHCPAFVMRPLDTVGAGDAVFSVTSLFAYGGHDNLIPFIANCAGGVKVSYMCNKESVTRDKLVQFIARLYNGMECL